MLSDFTFEELQVESTTTGTLQGRLQAGRGSFVIGPIGSGKSHAVRQAVNGAVWVSLREGPLQLPHLMADLALQVAPAGGRHLLERFSTRSVQDDLLAEVDQLLDGRWLVVDCAERLRRTPSWAADSPAEAVPAAETERVFDWLEARVGTTPTVVVGRRLPRWIEQQERIVRHTAPSDWTIKLVHTHRGFLDWRSVADKVHRRPGGLLLARAALQLLGMREFSEVLRQSEADESVSADEVMNTLCDVLRERLPRDQQRALHLVAALDGAPRGLLARALGEEGSLRVLVQLGLLESRGGDRLHVPPLSRRVLSETQDAQHQGLFLRTAQSLLDEVNDRRSLNPVDAERVLLAHGLYVRANDFENAARTAQLHVSGLIDLARRTSQLEDFHSARIQYAHILALLDAPGRGAADFTRYRSYALHYHGYNGHRASELPGEQVLDDYARARALWPENALWQGREASMLIRLGRLEESAARVHASYAEVPEHPRRDAFLRVLPARIAMEEPGTAALGLQLIEPILGATFADTDPQGAQELRSIMQRWEKGMALSELELDRGRLLLRRPLSVTLSALGAGYRAVLRDLGVTAQGERPTTALHALARSLASMTTELVRTPSHLLSPERSLMKGRLIGAVDLTNSDLGLEYATERWFLGRVEPGRFIPTQTEYAPISYDGPLIDESGSDRREGLYFARVPVFRDGHPKPQGPIRSLKGAGSGRRLDDLLRALRQLQTAEGAE